MKAIPKVFSEGSPVGSTVTRSALAARIRACRRNPLGFAYRCWTGALRFGYFGGLGYYAETKEAE